MTSAQAERLRAALLDPLEAQRMQVAGSVAAAVLAPLFERNGELHAVFTKRHSALRQHAGQISFPGGRREADDADLTQTALREAQEEIGLDPADVSLLGALSPQTTVVSDIAVYPIVGLIPAPTKDWSIAADEVDSVIEGTLSQVAASHRLERFQRSNGQTVVSDAYTLGEETIWGATARILGELLALLAGAESPRPT